jgi:hypothetical protein
MSKPRFIVDAPERYKELDQALRANARFESHTEYVTSSDADDVDIFKAAEIHDRHVLTQNKRDYMPFLKAKPNSKVGIVGFDPQTPTKRIIGMLKKEFKTNKNHEDFIHKSISLEEKYPGK